MQTSTHGPERWLKTQEAEKNLGGRGSYLVTLQTNASCVCREGGREEVGVAQTYAHKRNSNESGGSRET